ncbi:CDP-alcohol phosphatidyltransferase family protein [Thalassiella azotivora]
MSGAGPGDDEARWRTEHHLDAGAGGPLVGPWLRLVTAAARPLARRGVAPDLLTAAGVVAALAAVPVALAGGRWTLLVAALVLLTAAMDGLDGAVARLREHRSRWGGVVDATADRFSEAAFGLVLWVLGAPAALVVAAVAGTTVLEYARERAAATGAADAVVLTVAERPTRVIVTLMFALAAGVLPHQAAALATTGAFVWLATALVGAVQLVVGWGRLPR